MLLLTFTFVSALFFNALSFVLDEYNRIVCSVLSFVLWLILGAAFPLIDLTLTLPFISLIFIAIAVANMVWAIITMASIWKMRKVEPWESG